MQPEAEPVEGLLRQGLSALVAGGGPGGLVSGGVGAAAAAAAAADGVESGGGAVGGGTAAPSRTEAERQEEGRATAAVDVHAAVGGGAGGGALSRGGSRGGSPHGRSGNSPVAAYLTGGGAIAAAAGDPMSGDDGRSGGGGGGGSGGGGAVHGGGGSGGGGAVNAAAQAAGTGAPRWGVPRWGVPLCGDELSPSWRVSPASTAAAGGSAEPSERPLYLNVRQASGFAACPPTPSGALAASGWAPSGQVEMQGMDAHGHSRGVGTSEPALLSEPSLRVGGSRAGVGSLTGSAVLTANRSAERTPSGFPDYTLSTASTAIAASFSPAPDIHVAETLPLPPREPLPATPPRNGRPAARPPPREMPLELAVPAPEEERAIDLAPASSDSPMRGFRFVRGASGAAGASLERIL